MIKTRPKPTTGTVLVVGFSKNRKAEQPEDWKAEQLEGWKAEQLKPANRWPAGGEARVG